MNKNFFGPAKSLRSSSEILANSGQVIPEKKTPWNLQKAVPHHVLVARAAAQRKQDLRNLVDTMRAEHNAPKPLGIFANKVEGGYKVIGFGVTVATLPEVFQIAQANGRAFVKVDGAEVTPE